MRVLVEQAQRIIADRINQDDLTTIYTDSFSNGDIEPDTHRAKYSTGLAT
jgi:hypothetical protein